MDLLKCKLNNILILIGLFNSQLFFTQTKATIVDVETKRPIPFVSIYSKNGKNVIGASTNENGSFEFNFTFKTLYLKHINYADMTINKDEIKDTIYLTPKTNILSEVTVTIGQQVWITTLMQNIVKLKKDNYSAINSYSEYDYKTYSLSDSTGYAFKSNGNLLIPSMLKNEDININPVNSIVKYKNNTAGADFSNFEKMVYDDFIKNFNESFIKKYSFHKNHDFKNDNQNLIMFNFKSKKYADDNGYIVVDTISKAIIEYQRISGTVFNLKEKTSFIYRNFASSVLGAEYKDLQTQIYAKYEKVNSYYQLSESKIKSFTNMVRRKKGKDNFNFSSTEANLTLKTTSELPSTVQWIYLPEPSYIGIESKKERKAYEALGKISLKFEDFD